MKYWKKLSKKEIKKQIDKALESTVDFQNSRYLGYPVSKLDENVFNTGDLILNNSPLLQSYIINPNNIGCHTIGVSEEIFKGSQDLEKEVIKVLAVDIFKAKDEEYDGYIATGGTEANIQALWVFRNYFQNHHNAKINEMAILSSEDTHYSVYKGANLLNIPNHSIPVDFNSREIIEEELDAIVKTLKEQGINYFLVISNMATTMFGSVDNPDVYANILKKHDVMFKIHVDGAFGGFIYPITNKKSNNNFENPNVSSVTIDAHKMLQAPYGTGVYICRKGLIENAITKEAQYVNGMDLTISGSRSGANAIAVWLILFSYGYYAWFEKISVLMLRTDWLCEQLNNLKIAYFRDPFMNIVTIKSNFISEKLAIKHGLVPDSHSENKKWYKVIVMAHVDVDALSNFVKDLKKEL